MPSFRVTMTIGRLLPSVAPDRVLPAAAAETALHTVVEASTVAVVSGSARITVRFTAQELPDARSIAEKTVAATRELAEVHSWMLTEGVKGRWYPRF